ncbi:MAG: hypothetical protein ABIZ70_05320 [Gemmatimonadales bacterium]
MRPAALLLLLGFPTISPAQSAGDRIALATWDSTLRANSDVASILRFAPPPLSGRELATVAEALRNARLASLGKPRGYGRDGRDELEIVRRDRKEWPWAQYAVWRAEDAALSETGSIGTVWTQAMRLHRRPAIRALLDAIAADSGFTPALRELIRVAPYPMLWSTPEAELRMARAGRAAGVFDAEVAARHAQLELEVGSLDSVDVLLTQLGGTLPSPARYERLAAEVAFAHDDRDGGNTHYQRGIALILGVDDFDEFAADAEWIADSTEFAQISQLPVADAAAWLKAFWARRDLIAARLPGERLAEHFRRYRVALRDYRDGTGSNLLNGSRSANMEGFVLDEVASRQQPQTEPTGNGLLPIPRMRDGLINVAPRPQAIRILDDRGLTVLRHGAPDKSVKYVTDRAVSRSDTLLRYESWAYASSTRPLILHFGQYSASNPGQRLRNFPGGGDLLTPCGLDAGFCIAEVSGIRAQNLAERGARDATTAMSTDANPLRYRKDLEVLAQGYGIPGGGVLAVVAIPADRLVPKGAIRDTLREYVAHIRVVVGDSANGRILGTLDTIQRWHVPRTLGEGEWLAAWFEVAAAPGNWDVAIVANDTANTSGGGIRILGVPVAAFDGQTLRVGDPILGREESGLKWRRNSEIVPLNPTGAWRRNEAAILTYEVDGMVPDRQYETRLEIWELHGTSHAPKVTLTFKETARSTTSLVRRDLALREIGKGAFRVVVRVRDLATRAESTRSRQLIVK